VTLKEKKTILYLLYCLIAVVVIVGGVIIFRPSHTNPSVTPHSTAASHHSSTGVTAGKGGAQIATKNSSSANASSTKSNAANPALNNTGPGNVIAVFIVASILGAWFWRRKQLRSVIR